MSHYPALRLRRTRASAWSRRLHGEALARQYAAFPGPSIDWEGDGRSMPQRSREVLGPLIERGTLPRSESYGRGAGRGGFGEVPAMAVRGRGRVGVGGLWGARSPAGRARRGSRRL